MLIRDPMVDSRYPSNHRLHKPIEFDAVFKNRQYRLHCEEFLVLAMDNDKSGSRIGMVIGKKTTSLAVDRNRIKRRIRESFRTGFPQCLCVDIVIVARSQVNKAKGSKLTEILHVLWYNLENKIRTSG